MYNPLNVQIVKHGTKTDVVGYGAIIEHNPIELYFKQQKFLPGRKSNLPIPWVKDSSVDYEKIKELRGLYKSITEIKIENNNPGLEERISQNRESSMILDKMDAYGFALCRDPVLKYYQFINMANTENKNLVIRKANYQLWDLFTANVIDGKEGITVAYAMVAPKWGESNDVIIDFIHTTSKDISAIEKATLIQALYNSVYEYYSKKSKLVRNCRKIIYDMPFYLEQGFQFIRRDIKKDIILAKVFHPRFMEK